MQDENSTMNNEYIENNQLLYSSFILWLVSRLCFSITCIAVDVSVMLKHNLLLCAVIVRSVGVDNGLADENQQGIGIIRLS